MGPRISWRQKENFDRELRNYSVDNGSFDVIIEWTCRWTIVLWVKVDDNRRSNKFVCCYSGRVCLNYNIFIENGEELDSTLF